VERGGDAVPCGKRRITTGDRHGRRARDDPGGAAGAEGGPGFALRVGYGLWLGVAQVGVGRDGPVGHHGRPAATVGRRAACREFRPHDTVENLPDLRRDGLCNGKRTPRHSMTPPADETPRSLGVQPAGSFSMDSDGRRVVLETIHVTEHAQDEQPQCATKNADDPKSKGSHALDTLVPHDTTRCQLSTVRC